MAWPKQYFENHSFHFKILQCKEYPDTMEICRISKTEEMGKCYPEYTQGRLKFLFWF